MSVCQHCQEPLPAWGPENQKYCSSACRQAAYRARQPKKPKPTYQKCCPQCGAYFITTNKKAIYCTPLCRNRAFRARQQQKIQAGVK